MLRTESYFQSHDGLRLYLQDWMPADPKGHLILTHGLGEHSDCYENFVNELKTSHYRISVWDLRGHGRSQGARGAARDISLFSQDLEILLDRILKICSSKIPVVLMGHSMGGLILLKAVLGQEKLRRLPLVLSSPFLGTSLPIPEWKTSVSKLVAQTLPELTLGNEIDLLDLSRDATVIERYRRDPLRHHRISSGIFESALQSIETIFFRAKYYRGDTFVVTSDQDPVVSSREIQTFFNHLNAPKELHVLPNRRHEVFTDLGKDEAFQLLRNYLERRLEQRPKRRPYHL